AIGAVSEGVAIDIRDKIDYEGQAAVELEMAAYTCHCAERDSSLILGTSSAISDDNESYPYSITKDRGMRIIKLRELLQAIVEDLKQESSKARISVKFHNTVAQMTNEMCQLIADETQTGCLGI
ncbi:unnamed protein product, partial [marine sediment metagenome]